MDWILDHIRLIFIAAGAIAWWLNQRKQMRAAEQAKPAKEAGFEDPDLAERTRRIREEIQRKIEQRTKAYRESVPPALPGELTRPVPREVAKRQSAEPPVIAMPRTNRAEAQRNAEILEEQAALAEKLRQATELKAAAARRVQFENQISNEEEAKPVAAAALTADLRNPTALRRAFVLREIIGPPVALR